MRHWYDLLRATAILALAFTRAAWYFKTRALRDLALPDTGSLSSREKRRWQHYFYGTTYLNILFCSWRGYSRSRREKHLFSNLAALAYFFDDLVDSFRGKGDSGVLWRDNPEEYGHTADSSGLALHFLHNIYRELPPGDLEEFRGFMHRVFNVETAGRQQAGPKENTPGSRDLEKITAEKGGCSVLLFRRALAHPLPADEQNAWFQFGFLIQLCDDIFDLWHDRQAGTSTLATCHAGQNDVKGLCEIFENQVVVVREAFRHANPDSSSDGRRDTARTVPKGASPLPSGPGVGLACIHFLVCITRV